MTTNHWGDLVCTEEEYELLKNKLAEFGVVLKFSRTDFKTFDCYVRNPYKEVVSGWGNDLEKKLIKEFTDRYTRTA